MLVNLQTNIPTNHLSIDQLIFPVIGVELPHVLECTKTTAILFGSDHSYSQVWLPYQFEVLQGSNIVH